MSKSKVEGTKIAQAAKDLNVTSVTIRRYLSEFNIETATDENGIKVLPKHAMDELQEVRRLKEDGMTNPKVLEHLEEHRKSRKSDAKDKPSKSKEKDKDKEKEKEKEKPKTASRATRKVVEVEPEEDEEEEAPAAPEKEKKRGGRTHKPAVQEEADSDAEPASSESEGAEGDVELAGGDTKLKHSLTCQTCGKTFEHLNPRLRDCLDCYRAKRKERRRGGSDRHKNVIQHPLAQQVASKAQASQAQAARDAEPQPIAREGREGREGRDGREGREGRDRQDRDRGGRDRDRDRDRESGQREVAARESAPAVAVAMVPPASVQRPVRSYRKAIEETRVITGSLKRRLERPDLPEGERRWLEQIYAYQLILHQGWRHLAEYKATTQAQGGGRSSDD